MSETTLGEQMYELAREQDPMRPLWVDLTQAERAEWEKIASCPKRASIREIIKRADERN